MAKSDSQTLKNLDQLKTEPFKNFKNTVETPQIYTSKSISGIQSIENITKGIGELNLSDTERRIASGESITLPTRTIKHQSQNQRYNENAINLNLNRLSKNPMQMPDRMVQNSYSNQKRKPAILKYPAPTGGISDVLKAPNRSQAINEILQSHKNLGSDDEKVPLNIQEDFSNFEKMLMINANARFELLNAN